MTAIRENFNEATASYMDGPPKVVTLEFESGLTFKSDVGHVEPGVRNGFFWGDTNSQSYEEGCFEPGRTAYEEWLCLDYLPTYNLFEFDQPVTSITTEFGYMEIDVTLNWPGGGWGLTFDEVNTPVTITFDAPVTSFTITSGYAWYSMDYLEWTPIPEPSSSLLIALGLALVAKFVRSRPTGS